MRIVLLSLLIANSVLAGTYRIHYVLHGEGYEITLQAASSEEARRIVEQILPDSYVTNARLGEK